MDAAGRAKCTRSSRTPMLMLFAITGIVLLTACANIANLLLARAAGRSLEMSVRLSLGASRRHLLAQLLTESLLLAAMGGAREPAGGQVDHGRVRADAPEQLAVAPAGAERHHAALRGGRLVLTGLAFGLFPALHSTRPDLMGGIRGNAGQITGARSAARFRTSLATAQIALSMTLLISAGLFLRSLVNVSRVDLGLRPDSLVTFGISPDVSGYTREQSAGPPRAGGDRAGRDSRRHRRDLERDQDSRQQQLGDRRVRPGSEARARRRQRLAHLARGPRLFPDPRCAARRRPRVHHGRRAGTRPRSRSSTRPS